MSIANCTCYQVFIGSPSDCQRERIMAYRSILAWNAKYTSNTGRILLPRRWETDMVRTGSATGLQDMINADIVRESDLAVVFFKRRLGATRGTVREVQQLMDLGKHSRLVVLAYKNGDEADPDLKEYLENTIKPKIAMFPYPGVAHLPAFLDDYLYKRVAVTLASTSFDELRAALETLTGQWYAMLSGPPDGSNAFNIMSRVIQALGAFVGRPAGHPLAIWDDRARHLARRLRALGPTRDIFVRTSSIADADGVITLVGEFLRELPGEDELL